mmetsp:Transcript_45832/g.143361  ORF Transcript_45832/g.143361 Transcript_45832/m.143361 type:complete len:336 (-) Transcript_45832:306-1313(-)
MADEASAASSAGWVLMAVTVLVASWVAAGLKVMARRRGASLATRKDLGDFELDEVVCGSNEQVVLLGRFKGREGAALVTVKNAGSKARLDDEAVAMQCMREARLQLKKVNNNYGYYSTRLALFGHAAVDVVWPVDAETVQRQRPRSWVAVRETPALYARGVKPVAFSEAQTKRQQWVYQILDGVAEQDDVVYADEVFMLVSSPKWRDKADSAQLLLLAIPHDRELRTVRDLRGAHAAQLRHMQDKIFETCSEKYGLEPKDILLYFHYPPQFYHLHVHVCNVMRTHDRGVERGRLIDDVIANLEGNPNFYRDATVLYTTKEDSVLYQALYPKSEDE